MPQPNACVTLHTMSDGALSLRLARPGDAMSLARIYVEAWHDTYAAILPHRLLANMSVEMHAARLERAIRKGAVLVAEAPRHGVLGLAGFGAARDRGLGFDGEIYTLYVDPDFLGRGVGRALLHGAFSALETRAFHSCLIWSHAQNHACFFYEAMGGARIAERRVMLGGQEVCEVAFGWKRLALSPRRLPI
ncbi:MAG TPA: GNAT family N-acetyltransferase [Rhizomicrobium sp.]|nr:GNAT family N-acetyltransferase [Rhizomicrobium sp.]